MVLAVRLEFIVILELIVTSVLRLIPPAALISNVSELVISKLEP